MLAGAVQCGNGPLGLAADARHRAGRGPAQVGYCTEYIQGQLLADRCALIDFLPREALRFC